MRRRMIGIDAQRRAIGRLGLVQPIEVGQRPAQGAQGVGRVRGQPQGIATGQLGFGGVAQRAQHGPQTGMARCEIPAHRQAAPIDRLGFFVPPGARQQCPQIAGGLRRVGLQPQGMPESRLRLAEAAETFENQAQIALQGGIVGRDARRQVQQPVGNVEAPHLQRHHPQVLQCAGMSGIAPQHRAVPCLGLGDPTGLMMPERGREQAGSLDAGQFAPMSVDAGNRAQDIAAPFRHPGG